ncbi:hypothetical protein JDV02_008483 [Purpureocillium takamizusanense]|uniref:Uncharacterized protein n=1 Tax=Purpureocillium takamizusanense TaxID=2060973 RepID=A0A9Q8QQF3_9HYPO|nr:uncharacterized protein JDV02_008483 [Purpureocillium takamizusanense]UNI22612.1 hypothetical protein JDV02_008483 [Purpureocillium takamizusanense]
MALTHGALGSINACLASDAALSRLTPRNRNRHFGTYMLTQCRRQSPHCAGLVCASFGSDVGGGREPRLVEGLPSPGYPYERRELLLLFPSLAGTINYANGLFRGHVESTGGPAGASPSVLGTSPMGF